VAYLAADNEIAKRSDPDLEALNAIVRKLHDESTELSELAFGSTEELLQLLSPSSESDADAEPQIDKAEELRVQWGVETGQLWQLGDHRLLCGDSTKPEDVARLMGGEKAVICWTDPPWNVAYGASDHPSYRKREIINDNLGAGFNDFATEFCLRIKETLVAGGMLYMAMSAQEWGLIMQVLAECGFHWSSTIIWNKSHPVMSRKDYHTKYEPIWYGWSDGAPRVNPLEDRRQCDVWDIPRPTRSEEHPTMKPVELVTRSLRNSSKHGAVVYEPFCGSGTTIIAAEQLGRKCYAMEISPGYVAVILERYSQSTGKRPQLIQ
jgi:DNA modification methylase